MSNSAFKKIVFCQENIINDKKGEGNKVEFFSHCIMGLFCSTFIYIYLAAIAAFQECYYVESGSIPGIVTLFSYCHISDCSSHGI